MPVASLKAGRAALMASESASDVAYSMVSLAGLGTSAAKASDRPITGKAAPPARAVPAFSSARRESPVV